MVRPWRERVGGAHATPSDNAMQSPAPDPSFAGVRGYADVIDRVQTISCTPKQGPIGYQFGLHTSYKRDISHMRSTPFVPAGRRAEMMTEAALF